MKNLLAIVGDYYPHPSSNTNCTEPLLRGLEQKGWSVDVVTVKQWLELPNHEIEKSGREIWRIDDPRSMNTILQNQVCSIPAPRLLKTVNKLFAFVSKSLFYARYCLRAHDKRYAGWPRGITAAKCKELHRAKGYDVVLSVSHPAKCHEIAQEFLDALSNDKRPRWILYELDPYCYNEHLYGKDCYRKLSASQHDLFAAADAVCVTPELYDFYQQTPFGVYMDKMISVGFPNMKAIEYTEEDPTATPLADDRINCVFAGSLNAGIRSPRYTLEVFALCGGDLRLSIMTSFELGGILQEIDGVSSSVKAFPSQSLDTAHRTMESADVLVNIGNTIALQTPGKIFEYMALGKPIVHFRKIEDDPCLKYFHDYPMVLVVDEREDDRQKQARRVVEFCKRYAGKTLAFEEVSQRMPQLTSEVVVDGFVSMVERLIAKGGSDGDDLG